MSGVLPWPRHRRVSLESVYSTMSGISMDKHSTLRKIMKQDPSVSRRRDILNMLLVMLVPITSLIALTAIEFSNAVTTHEISNRVSSGILVNFDYAAVTLNLQVERGMTAMFLSSGGSNNESFNVLEGKRALTDQSIGKLRNWPRDGITINRQVINSSDSLGDFIQRYRSTVRTTSIPFEYNIQFYTNITHALMAHTENNNNNVPSGYAVWKYMVANSAILRVSDAVGIQRALGSTFFTLCGFKQDNYVWFVSLDGEQKSYFSTANTYCKECKRLYETAVRTQEQLIREIDRKKSYMSDLAWQANCRFNSVEKNFSNSQSWFDDITSYIKILVKVRTHARDLMLTSLAQSAQSANVSLGIYSVVILAVTSGSLIIAFWYTLNVRNVINSIRDFTLKVKDKNRALKSEKKRSEIILNQMLPKTVSEQLLGGRNVAAEEFQCVTVMFTDIVGFTRFASSIPPLRVVDVLNELYSFLDDEIDKHDAYKVETIGDAYMVVSGAPERNNNKHAREIARVAMQFLSALDRYTIPDAPGGGLKMRIGIHSGPCVAAVVGAKMPRYCLFGETILIAARMEQTADAMSIHISETTEELLRDEKVFQLREGQPTQASGKTYTTYWLLGERKQTMPARHINFGYI